MTHYLIELRDQIFAQKAMDFYLLLKIWTKALLKIKLKTANSQIKFKTTML